MRLAAVLLALAVLASQAFAVQHVHLDDAPSVCVVCAHADDEPAVDAGTKIAALSDAPAGFSTRLPLSITQQIQLSPPVRAPPHS